METLDKYIEDCRRLSDEAFGKTYDHPWLVMTTDEDSSDTWRAFRTTAVTDTPSGAQEKIPHSANSYRVMKIVKSAKNSWPDRISVGRARNNDLIIRDRSVSKLHAHFSTDDKGNMVITDAGSRNGTRVNGEETRSEGIALRAGDEIQLGRVEAVFQDPRAFFDFLKSILDGE